MRIELQSISISNFRGCRNLSIVLNGKNAVISGRNSSGKSTVYNAFIWCLFGKDSLGRNDFMIRPIVGGEVLHEVDCSVTLELKVDGRPKTLRRVYKENWTRKRGSTEKTLEGNITEFYIDGVKCSTKMEYDMAVGSIIEEETFKLITRTGMFFSLTPDKQREILFSLVDGQISDEEVSKSDKRFAELLREINGEDIVTFNKMLSQKKKTVSSECKEIPINIKAYRSSLPDVVNYDEVRKSLNEKEESVKSIDSKIATLRDSSEAFKKRLSEANNAILKKDTMINELMSNISSEFYKERNDAFEKRRKIEFEIDRLNTRLKIAGAQHVDTSKISERIEGIKNDMDSLRDEYIKKYNDRYKAPESIKCPTCGQLIPEDEYERRINDAEDAFNNAKARTLKSIQDKGVSLKNTLAQEESSLESANKKNEEYKIERESIIDEIKKKTAERDSIVIPETGEPDYDTEEIKRLKNEKKEIELSISNPDFDNDSEISSLKSEKQTLDSEIKELYKILGQEEIASGINESIKVLEDSLKKSNIELSRLEELEYLSKEFQKTKDSMIEDKINNQFKLVSFSFTSDQINGGYKITCVPHIDGIDIRAVNNSSYINAGIDVINALSAKYSVSAPIFVDNAEAVNDVISTGSQLIKLVVNDEDFDYKLL